MEFRRGGRNARFFRHLNVHEKQPLHFALTARNGSERHRGAALNVAQVPEKRIVLPLPLGMPLLQASAHLRK